MPNGFYAMSLFFFNRGFMGEGVSAKMHSIIISHFTSILLLAIISPASRGASGVIHKEVLDFCPENVIKAWQRPRRILREGVYANAKTASTVDDSFSAFLPAW